MGNFGCFIDLGTFLLTKKWTKNLRVHFLAARVPGVMLFV
jgi:hypothetical protein